MSCPSCDCYLFGVAPRATLGAEQAIALALVAEDKPKTIAEGWVYPFTGGVPPDEFIFSLLSSTYSHSIKSTKSGANC